MTTDTFAPGFAQLRPVPHVTVRGAHARRLRRITKRADARAQRRFRAWLDYHGDREIRFALSESYQEAEHLMDRLLAAMYAR